MSDNTDLIDEKTFFLRISENNLYNYKLELRQSGLVIKPLNNVSRIFLDKTKAIVIETSINEASQLADFKENQIKTIIIDLSKD